MKIVFRRRRHALPAALAVLALSATGPALGTQYNVSQLVLGAAEPSPPGWFGVSCGQACRYTSVAGTQMSNGYASWPGALSHATWPVFPALPPPSYSSVQDALAVAAPPAGIVDVGLPSGVLQRARVNFSASIIDPPSARQLDVQTFKSGTGASALSYAVRIEMPPGNARRTFLHFGVPTLVRDSLHASRLGGPSGNEPIVTRPLRLQARSAVDVYVDGLPVWSSESMRLQPQRHRPDTPGMLGPAWGPALDGDTVTLFLGSLPAGSTRTAVIVMRSDLRVDAPTCHTEHFAHGSDQRRCDAELEGLRLPSRSLAPFYSHTPDILVYMQ